MQSFKDLDLRTTSVQIFEKITAFYPGNPLNKREVPCTIHVRVHVVRSSIIIDIYTSSLLVVDGGCVVDVSPSKLCLYYAYYIMCY